MNLIKDVAICPVSMIIPPFKGFIIVSFTYQDEKDLFGEIARIAYSGYLQPAELDKMIGKETTTHFREKISLS